MAEFIDGIWEELNGLNLSEIYSFYVDEERLTYDFTPTIVGEHTISWINFNFNINKAVDLLKYALKSNENTPNYYIMCDNALVLLVSAFESYLASCFNNIREHLGKTKIDPRLLSFQRKENLKEKYLELNIDITHLDDTLWLRIFSASETEKGIIKTRNVIVHNGWKGFENKSDMLNHKYIKRTIINICTFLKKVENEILKKYPNLILKAKD